MKKQLSILTVLAALLLASCFGGTSKSGTGAAGGEVTGVSGSNLQEPAPYGMVLVKRGSLKARPLTPVTSPPADDVILLPKQAVSSVTIMVQSAILIIFFISSFIFLISKEFSRSDDGCVPSSGSSCPSCNLQTARANHYLSSTPKCTPRNCSR